MLLKYFTIIFLINLKLVICNATESTNNTTCPPGYLKFIIDHKVQCFAQCKETCKNGFCSKVDECTCFGDYQLDPNNKFNCIPKPTLPPPIPATTIGSATTTKSVFVSSKKERDVEMFGDVPINTSKEKETTTISSTTVEPSTTMAAITTTTTFENESTVKPNSEITTIDETTFVIDQDNTTNYSKLEYEKIIEANTSICELDCFKINAICFNGSCKCEVNLEYDNETKICIDQNDSTKNLSHIEIDSDDTYYGSDSSTSNKNHDNFYIIGYVIIALILLLAILSAIIIYLLLREKGSNYNVSKYEKKFGTRYGNRSETELQEIPLRNGADNNYYDADRFLDDRKYV